VGQGNEMAIRAEWIRFRGADGGVGRGNKQEGKQNVRESSENESRRTDGWNTTE
jgi:hypothetical protein